jgi:hypothetical protein
MNATLEGPLTHEQADAPTRAGNNQVRSRDDAVVSLLASLSRDVYREVFTSSGDSRLAAEVTRNVIDDLARWRLFGQSYKDVRRAALRLAAEEVEACGRAGTSAALADVRAVTRHLFLLASGGFVVAYALYQAALGV